MVENVHFWSSIFSVIFFQQQVIGKIRCPGNCDTGYLLNIEHVERPRQMGRLIDGMLARKFPSDNVYQAIAFCPLDCSLSSEYQRTQFSNAGHEPEANRQRNEDVAP